MTETEAKWSDRVREWRSSGKSAEQFAEGRGFEPTTLRYWASRLGRSKAARSAETPSTSGVRMVRVERVSAASPIVITIGAARVEVSAGFDRALLAEVAAALGAAR